MLANVMPHVTQSQNVPYNVKSKPETMGEILKAIQFCVLKIRNYNTFKFLTLT